jgi:lauroyl/myristoyl acyltransferase
MLRWLPRRSTGHGALVRECPGQYLWGYARYKAPREDATP